MTATFRLLAVFILSSTLLHAQTPPSSTQAPTAPPAPTQPLSMNDQAYARSVSAQLQMYLQLSLAGKRTRANDPDLSKFSDQLNRSFTAIWTPFVTICQTHKFDSIAIDVSRSQTEAIAKLSKLRGAEFRTQYFKMFKPEVQRSIAFLTTSIPRIQHPELKDNAVAMLDTCNKTAGLLDAKSTEPFQPSAKAKLPGKQEKPEKKKQ